MKKKEKTGEKKKNEWEGTDWFVEPATNSDAGYAAERR